MEKAIYNKCGMMKFFVSRTIIEVITVATVCYILLGQNPNKEKYTLKFLIKK